MTPRFRLIAGPNGSGKSTLVARLARDYDVNFYTQLNADDFFAAARREGRFALPFAVDGGHLSDYVQNSDYEARVKSFFSAGDVAVCDDCVRFRTTESVNSYTVALVTNFLQQECIARKISFSQETVFSHPSKVAALETARMAGFRTYLYFVSTMDATVNVERVRNRLAQGGHGVPEEKIRQRYMRAMKLLRAARPFLSRAFFFDNSGTEMRHLASWSCEEGLCAMTDDVPQWYRENVMAFF